MNEEQYSAQVPIFTVSIQGEIVAGDISECFEILKKSGIIIDQVDLRRKFGQVSCKEATTK